MGQLLLRIRILWRHQLLRPRLPTRVRRLQPHRDHHHPRNRDCKRNRGAHNHCLPQSKPPMHKQRYHPMRHSCRGRDRDITWRCMAAAVLPKNVRDVTGLIRRFWTRCWRLRVLRVTARPIWGGTVCGERCIHTKFMLRGAFVWLDVHGGVGSAVAF